MHERELRSRRKFVRLEPAQLDEIVTRPRLPGGMDRPRQAEHDPPVIGLEPEAEEVDRFDLEGGLLTDLSPQRVERMLVLVEKTAGQVPEALAGIEGATAEEHLAPLVEADRLRAGHGVRVAHVTASRTFGPVLDLLDSLAADRTEEPGVERTHGGGTMHDQPEPAEEEQEQAPERLQDEEAQRGNWEDNPRQAEEEREE